MSRILWTADTHLGHERILELEPERGKAYSDKFDMVESMVDVWNQYVNPDDSVIHCGDLAMGSPFQDYLDVVSRLNGQITLIAGNHDRCSPTYGHKKSVAARKIAQETKRYMDAGIYEVMDGARLFDHGADISVSHFPLIEATRGDHGKDIRYAEHRMSANERNSADFHFHGHVHSNSVGEQVEREDGSIVSCFNVGWDIFGRPVTTAEVLASQPTWKI